MPFTFCHPAIVVPLHRCARRWTSLAGLVIGSMTPDVVYFFPIGPGGAFTHSIAGVALFCMPAGLLMFIVYYGLLRQPLLACAPVPLAARMAPTVPWRPRSARTAMVLLASLAIGAASHIAWDAFTHANSALVQKVDVLRAHVTLGALDAPVFKLLQHGSSLLGLLLLAGYAASWYRTADIVAPPAGLGHWQKRRVWLVVFLAFLGGGMAGLLLRPANSLERGLFHFIVTAIAAASVAIVLWCAGRTMRTASQRRRRTEAA